MNIFQIFDENEQEFQFYFESYKYYLGDFKVSAFEDLKAARLANDENQMVRLANKIWFALPDEPHIRRYIFFRLCDIAEHEVEEPQPE